MGLFVHLSAMIRCNKFVGKEWFNVELFVHKRPRVKLYRLQKMHVF